MQRFFSLLSWRLFTAQHASGVLSPIIRSSMTAVAASGFTFVSWWQSCCVRGRSGRPTVPTDYGVPLKSTPYNSCGVPFNSNPFNSCGVPFNSNPFNSCGVPFNSNSFNSCGVLFNSNPFNSCGVPFNSNPFNSCRVPFKSSLLIFPVINSRISIPEFLPRRQRHLEQLVTDVDVATSSSWETRNCSRH